MNKIFKVYVKTYGSALSEPMATNAMEYPTRALAEAAAIDLFSRWTAVSAWEVREEPSRTPVPTEAT